MSNPPEEQSNSGNELLQADAEIAGGAAIGAAVGFLMGDPSAALTGATTGGATPVAVWSLQQLVRDLNSRLRGRERVRGGAALALAIIKIQENIDAGYQIRDDNLFQDKIGDRSTAKEIAEGVIASAQREYEEKKVKFFANLLGNIVFEKRINRGYANLLIKQAGELSYQQLCLLSIFGNNHNLNLREENYHQKEIPDSATPILLEAYGLVTRGMINMPGVIIITPVAIAPNKVNIQGAGYGPYHLMELSKIEQEDLNPIIEILRL